MTGQDAPRQGARRIWQAVARPLPDVTHPGDQVAPTKELAALPVVETIL